MTARPNPAALRSAADRVEAAEAADAAKLAADKVAADKKAEAEKAEAEMVAALKAVETSGAASAASSVTTSTIKEFCSGCGRNLMLLIGAIAATAVIALLVSFWGVISSFILANGKASEARVDGVTLIATNAGNTAAETKGKVDVMAGNLRDTQATAADAKVKAAEAVTKADAASVKADAADAKAAKSLSFAHKHRPHQVSPVPSVPKPNVVPPVNVGQLSGVSCQVSDRNGKVLADFLTGNNPKKLVVKTGEECLKARDAYVAEHGLKTIDRQIVTRN